MILAVGYRVKSNVGIHFRRWASNILSEYMKKGVVLNYERLRNPKEFGSDYVLLYSVFRPSLKRNVFSDRPCIGLSTIRNRVTRIRERIAPASCSI